VNLSAKPPAFRIFSLTSGGMGGNGEAWKMALIADLSKTGSPELSSTEASTSLPSSAIFTPMMVNRSNLMVSPNTDQFELMRVLTPSNHRAESSEVDWAPCLEP